MKNTIVIGVAAAVLIAVGAAPAAAQGAMNPGGEIPSEKRMLITKLLELTKAKETAEEVTDLMMNNMEASYPQVIAGVLNQAGALEGADREELQGIIVESQQRFSQKFREEYPKRVNFEEVIKDIYYPLYDKYYTTAELQDLVEFHSSPTGRKVVDVMPQLMEESMQKSAQMLNPKIIELINEIMEQERARLESELGVEEDAAAPAGS